MRGGSGGPDRPPWAATIGYHVAPGVGHRVVPGSSPRSTPSRSSRRPGHDSYT